MTSPRNPRLSLLLRACGAAVFKAVRLSLWHLSRAPIPAAQAIPPPLLSRPLLCLRPRLGMVSKLRNHLSLKRDILLVLPPASLSRQTTRWCPRMMSFTVDMNVARILYMIFRICLGYSPEDVLKFSKINFAFRRLFVFFLQSAEQKQFEHYFLIQTVII